MTTKQLFEEFISIIEDIHGIYLDSSMGFVQNKKLIEESQKKTMDRLDVSETYVDNLPMTFKVRTYNDSNEFEFTLHQSKQGEFNPVMSEAAKII